MLEHLQDRTEASYLVTELARRIIEEEADVVSKLRYIRRAIAYAKGQIAEEDAEELRILMLAPDTAKYFEGSEFSLHDGSYRAVAAKNTETHLDAIMSYVAASGLVFAHSFLEFVLETLLRMTRLCDISPWLSFIQAKNIPLSTIMSVGLESAVEEKLQDFVTSLPNKALITKIDYLAEILKSGITESGVIDYKFDRERMAAIDKLRHDLAHHRKKDYGLEAAQSDITYVCRTALHFFDLVIHHFDLHGAHRPKTSAGE
jgi:hypothetical protein